ncbi:MAG: pilus assembly protein [Acidimicrobiales bacterium]|nr:pilus assembly protein [Acidimicrobiales bacterium]
MTGRRRRGDTGQATVELALVLPVLAVVGLLVVQVALIGRGEVMTVHAAREAARAMAVGEPDAQAHRAAMAAGSFPPHRVDVDVGRTGETVAVQVRYRQATAVPIVGALLGDVEHRAEATMRLER